MIDAAQGVHGHGSNAFSACELERVRAYIVGVTPGAPETVAAIAATLNLDGRLVRSALSWLDGREVLLGGHNEGYFRCAVADQGDQLTAALASQAARMMERLGRRRGFALSLERQQPPLFD